MICSCETESPEIGSDFFTNGVLDFTYIDSATVNLSTIQLDEMVTSSASRMLVGTHRDERLGQITATPYFQVTPTGEVNFEDKNFAYDHLSFVLPLDHYSYYDTLLPLTLNVHRVTEDITTENGYFYNSSFLSNRKQISRFNNLETEAELRLHRSKIIRCSWVGNFSEGHERQ